VREIVGFKDNFAGALDGAKEGQPSGAEDFEIPQSSDGYRDTILKEAANSFRKVRRIA
jgi:hypothetical protein